MERRDRLMDLIFPTCVSLNGAPPAFMLIVLLVNSVEGSKYVLITVNFSCLHYFRRKNYTMGVISLMDS